MHRGADGCDSELLTLTSAPSVKFPSHGRYSALLYLVGEGDGVQATLDHHPPHSAAQQVVPDVTGAHECPFR